MKRQNLKNKELDQIGSRLLKVTKPNNEEIEKIVDDPKLFNSIQMRVAAAAEQINVERENGFADWGWLKLSFINRQSAINMVAVLVVFVFFAVLIFVNNQESTQVAEENKIVKSTIKSELTKVSDSLEDSETGVKKDFAPEKSESDKAIISKEKSLRPSKRIRKTNSVKPQYASAKSLNKPKRVKSRKSIPKKSRQITKQEPQKVFYMLPYNGNNELDSEKIQIVTAKLSRSELFALGVNLQLENESSAVETELIIGDDGVARAIRVVEKY